MLYRIEYRYFYYDRDFTHKICHVKLTTYDSFEKEPTKKELVEYFNKNLINKYDDMHRNKLRMSKVEDKEEIYVENLDVPANIIVEKVLENGKCYITSGAGFRESTSQENIREGVSEEYKKYGRYIDVKEREDFKKLSKKKQERVLKLIEEMNERDEETEYSEDNLRRLESTMNFREIDRFLKGF